MRRVRGGGARILSASPGAPRHDRDAAWDAAYAAASGPNCVVYRDEPEVIALIDNLVDRRDTSREDVVRDIVLEWLYDAYGPKARRRSAGHVPHADMRRYFRDGGGGGGNAAAGSANAPPVRQRSMNAGGNAGTGRPATGRPASRRTVAAGRRPRTQRR